MKNNPFYHTMHVKNKERREIMDFTGKCNLGLVWIVMDRQSYRQYRQSKSLFKMPVKRINPETDEA